MESSVVHLEKVTKSFPSGEGKVEVLKGITLNVEQGEYISVMGASGSGKSTLLNIVGALLRSDGGLVSIAGKNLWNLSDKELTLFRRRDLGFIFQMYNLIPSLSVEENVLLPILADNKKLKRSATADKEAQTSTLEDCHRILERVGLSGKEKRKPGELSGGEQQRVAIARALFHKPSLVLADEPTGNLDSTNSEIIGELFHSLHQETGTTMMVVTHEPSVALWGQRIIILRDGRIAADESTSRFATSTELASFYQEVIHS
jgi:putative ABC transport system ATP-binding protein